MDSDPFRVTRERDVTEHLGADEVSPEEGGH
jgi:hypothetical protein